DLVHAVARDVDLEVARQRHDRRRLLVRVQAHEHDRVRAGARATLDVVLRPLVGAEDEERLGLPRVGRGERVPAEPQLGVHLERVHDLVHLVERRDGGGGGRREDAQEAAHEQALPQSGPGEVLEHQAIRSRRSSSPPCASRAGSRFTNSTSAARYSPSDRIDTHSSGPWWPSPDGPHSTAGTPASRKEMASDAPSRPTPSRSLVGAATREMASPSACTYGSSRDTIAGARWNTLMTCTSESSS